MKATIPGTPGIITFNFNVGSYYNFYHLKLFPKFLLSKFRYFPSNCCYLLLSYQWYFDSALKQQEGIQSDGMSVDWRWIIGKCRRMVLSFLTIHVSISPTFNARLFRTKVLREPLLCLHLRFELFLAQEYWRKCAHKMLVKLTTSQWLTENCQWKSKHQTNQLVTWDNDWLTSNWGEVCDVRIW